VNGGYYTSTVPSVGTTGACLGALSAAAAGATQTTLTASCGSPSDTWGYAFNAGFTLVNFAGMRGDSLGGQATYSKGAVGYSIAPGGNAVFGGGNTLAVGNAVDGVFTNGSNISLTQAISFDTAYEHIWSPNWRSSLEGGMYFVNYGSGAVGMICPNGPSSAPVGFFGTAGGFTTNAASKYNCNPNSSASQLNFKLAWQPVPDIDIWWGVGWYHFNSAFSGSTVSLPQLGARASGTYTIGDTNEIVAGFRVQRFFLY
jgi:hypothetical protein